MARRLLWWGLVLMLSAATVASLSLGVWQMKAGHRTSPDRPEARDTVLQVVRDGIPKLLGYTPESAESSMAEALPLLTDRYKQEWLKHLQQEILPQIRDRKLTNQVSVPDAGIETLNRDSATVLVFVNRTITAQDREPVYDGSALRVKLLKVGNAWLVDDIQPT